MLRVVVLLLLLVISPGVALAQACPPVVVDQDRKADLMAQLRMAPDEMTARAINDQLWEIWAAAPTPHAQDLLDEGLQRRSTFDLDAAMIAFEALIVECPGYAEGYNQRAFIFFIRQDYGPALVDLEKALDLVPDHIGALSGRALTLMGLGRNDEAQQVLRDALALNPWLPERRFLVEPDGDDI
ncbi:hypothetical protein IU397_13895 [Actibacterium sp. 188UL27-1]|nr:hypothetical protein [Actibacterium sp. 188UL27-1]